MKGKKVILIVVGVVVALAVLGVGAAFLFLVPPSAEKVCEKVRDLTKAEVAETLGGDEAAQAYIDEEMPVDECVKDVKRHREAVGLLKAKQEGTCIMKAKTFDDMDKCSQ